MSEHVVPARFYVFICVTLLSLTALTVWVAFIDLGRFNLLAALAIACAKATLVLLYFMHVRWSKRLVSAVVVAGVLWIFLLLALMLSDYLSRSWSRGAEAEDTRRAAAPRLATDGDAVGDAMGAV